MNHFTGYGAYLLFLALRTHFTNERYDFFQMHGKLRANKESYLKRHDKAFFEKLAREYKTEELKDFYVANFLKDRHYVTDLLDQDSKDAYVDYMRRRQSLSYTFTNELDRLFRNGVTKPFSISSGEYPYIISLYLGGYISPETMVITSGFVPYFSKFDDQLGVNDPLWSTVSLKLRKYKPFLKYDSVKMKDILKGKLNEQRQETEKVPSKGPSY
jgi:hypothetical protein